MAEERRQITVRLTIRDPVPGVAYSLQHNKTGPIGKVIAEDQPLSFDVPVTVAPGPRFLGEYVRREGPTRRFLYIAIGERAGDSAASWSRRAKIDIHDIPADLLDMAFAGVVIEIIVPGKDKHGRPACASLRPLEPWKVAE